MQKHKLAMLGTILCFLPAFKYINVVTVSNFSIGR